MPYITQTARQVIADGGSVETGGELNYVFTKSIKEYLAGEIGYVALADEVIGRIEKFIIIHGKSYTTFNTILGALEGAVMELDRRIGVSDDVHRIFDVVKKGFYLITVAPYEDQKIKENGDVY
jgi:hypothetical protein